MKKIKVLSFFIVCLTFNSIAVENAENENRYTATVITTSQKFVNVKFASILDDRVRIKADYMKDEGLVLSRDEVISVIFPGGKEDAKGIVLRNGLSLNGTVKQFTNGEWYIDVDDLKGVSSDSIKKRYGELLLGTEDILSVNFKEKALIIPKTGDENWKYNTSINVLEWIYTNDKAVFGENVPYKLNIEKIAFSANKIFITSYVYSDNFSENRCYINCTLDDDKRNQYKPLQINIGHIPTESGKKKLMIHCPAPKQNADEITILLQNHDNNSGWKRCGNQDWWTLPSFNMKLLK